MEERAKMKEKKCIFIDHAYHKTTISTAFFDEILRDEYEIERIYVKEYSELEFAYILSLKCDLYVVFQLDFLVGILLSNGFKVVSIPMWDGSGSLQRAHWTFQQGALIVNFSRTLHDKLIEWGIKSILWQFYPAVSEPAIDFGEDIRVFFWERVPSQGLSTAWVSRLARMMLVRPSQVHLHLCPDPGEVSSQSLGTAQRLMPFANVSTSTWTDDKSEYLNKLRKCNMFVAPRANEGIGMAMLEAMSLGMVVLAIDNPTMNEYIVNNVNGILLKNVSSELPLNDLEELKQIGNEARKTVLQGHMNSQNDALRIQNEIKIYVNSKQDYNKIHAITPRESVDIGYWFIHDRRLYLWKITSLLYPHRKLIPNRTNLAGLLSVCNNELPVLTHVVMLFWGKIRNWLRVNIEARVK